MAQNVGRHAVQDTADVLLLFSYGSARHATVTMHHKKDACAAFSRPAFDSIASAALSTGGWPLNTPSYQGLSCNERASQATDKPELLLPRLPPQAED